MDKYGDIFKRLRKKSKKSVTVVISELNHMGISITASALYNYENNTRAASAEILLALCQIYGCTNVLEEFANIPPDYSIPTDEEWTMIEKYRALDSRGQQSVLDTLEREYSYTEEAKKGNSERDFA